MAKSRRTGRPVGRPRKPKADIIRIPGWLTVKEAAEVLGCSQGQIRWYVVKGYLPEPARLSDAPHAHMLFKESEINEYKATHPRVGLKRAENLRQKAADVKRPAAEAEG